MAMITTSAPQSRVALDEEARRPGRRTARLGLWAAETGRRRFVKRVLAETRDPAILEELDIRPVRSSHLERWVMAMLWHQR